MKNAKKPDPWKKLERNEKVTVQTTYDRARYWRNVDTWNRQHWDGRVFRARVKKSWRRGALVQVNIGAGFVYARIYRDEEGKTWVRGWDTDEARAMMVSEALL